MDYTFPFPQLCVPCSHCSQYWLREKSFQSIISETDCFPFKTLRLHAINFLNTALNTFHLHFISNKTNNINIRETVKTCWKAVSHHPTTLRPCLQGGLDNFLNWSPCLVGELWHCFVSSPSLSTCGSSCAHPVIRTSLAAPCRPGVCTGIFTLLASDISGSTPALSLGACRGN